MGDPESYPGVPKASIGALIRDPGFIAALVMLILWGVGTFALAPAPGWLHVLLSVGVFLLIYRVVVLGTRRRDEVGPRGS
ncbi:MAG: hypothetical protein NVS1B4_04070 [Gemmatimonadaceae bacterium]